MMAPGVDIIGFGGFLFPLLCNIHIDFVSIQNRLHFIYVYFGIFRDIFDLDYEVGMCTEVTHWTEEHRS